MLYSTCSVLKSFMPFYLQTQMILFQMSIIKVHVHVSLSYVVCMRRSGHAIQSLWCIHLLHIYLLADTGDFLADDDYQGNSKLHVHNVYAWSWPSYTCGVYINP